MIGCGVNGIHNSDEDLRRFLSSLITHTARLKELIELVSEDEKR
jgi:hypothetical protein